MAGVLAATTAAAPARADDDESPFEYAYTDGAVPLFWLPLIATGVSYALIGPPDEPRLFDPDEGGAEHKGDTIPEAAVAAFAVAGLLGVAVTPAAEARMIHFKGMAEAMATTLFITEVTKNVFGRHRPEYQVGDDDPDMRKSFVSGHSSLMFQTTTYLSLYLNQHVFSRWRASDRSFAWWEVAPYAARAGLSGYVAYSRTADNRHNPSDVIAGGLVGAAVSTAIFWWHEARFEREHGSGSNAPMLGPGPGVVGVTFRTQF